MSAEQFTTTRDDEIREVMLSIPEVVYTGSRDTYDAKLVEVETNGASYAHPYHGGPSLQAEDTDSGSVFTMISRLSPHNAQSRDMTFSTSLTESLKVSPSLLPPEVEVTKIWAYSAYAREEGVSRDPCTIVTIGNHSIFLYPDVPLIDRHLKASPTELISKEWLLQLEVPLQEELGVQRFNRIVSGLGFGILQIS